MIEAIVFDFRDTLLKVENGYKAMNDALFRFVRQKGARIGRKQLVGLNHVIIKKQKYRIAKNKKIHDATPVFVAALLKDLKIQAAKKELDPLFKNMADRFVSRVSVYPDAYKLLKLLKGRKIKTALVIDGTIKRENAIIQRLKLKDYVNAAVISEQIGFNKFTSKPLAAALRKLKVDPKQVLVIGDRLDKDIAHANRLGCVSVRLVRHGGRYADLVGTKSAEKPKFIISSLDEVPKFLA